MIVKMDIGKWERINPIQSNPTINIHALFLNPLLAPLPPARPCPALPCLTPPLPPRCFSTLIHCMPCSPPPPPPPPPSIVGQQKHNTGTVHSPLWARPTSINYNKTHNKTTHDNGNRTGQDRTRQDSSDTTRLDSTT